MVAADDQFQRAVARLRAYLPRGSRLIRVGETPIGTGDEAFGKFNLVSCYSHSLGLSVFESLGHRFIISNTFLASHAYNLALVLAFYRGCEADHDKLRLDLRHNFKKVFAECALYERNCLIGRALLIETLAFEQDIMRPLFTRAANDPEFKALADRIRQVTIYLTQYHELVHVLESSNPGRFWEEFDRGDDPDIVALFRKREVEAGRCEAIETLCDALGCHLLCHGDGEFKKEIADPLERLRLCGLAFLLFGQLFAVERAAQLTARRAVLEDTHVELGSETRTDFVFSYVSARAGPLDDRVAAVLGYLEQKAQRLGASLSDGDGPFVIDEGLKGVLQDAAENFADLAEPDPVGLNGTDLHRRGLAQLLAESLHSHDAGVDHLLWRSKRFVTADGPIDP